MYLEQIRDMRKIIIEEKIKTTEEVATLSDTEIENIIKDKYVMCIEYEEDLNTEEIILIPKEEFSKYKKLVR